MTSWATKPPERSRSLFTGRQASKSPTQNPFCRCSLRAVSTLHTDQRQLIDQVFKAFGVIAMIDDSVRAIEVRLDVDNASFEDTTQILGLVTHTFFVPLDAHHVVVADDTIENRRRLTPEEMETVYLSGMTTTI